MSDAQFRARLAAVGYSGVNGSAVGPDTLVDWYKLRIGAEGRWRTYARILSDSSHACSSILHANALASTSKSGNVWRYFFAYCTTPGEGAWHGADEQWLLNELNPRFAPTEIALSHEMGFWWASLNAAHNPNTEAAAGAPVWSKYNPTSAPSTMFLGLGPDPLPMMNATENTVNVECEHWKQFLGWY